MLDVFLAQNADKHQSAETKAQTNRLKMLPDILSVSDLQNVVENLQAQVNDLSNHFSIIAK